jgi:hypothetical protein
VVARVVDDGDLVSCGAVTSGLDLALHLLDRTYGPKVALAGTWDVTIKTPIGSLAVVYTFTETGGAQSGSATLKDETVPLRDLAVDGTHERPLPRGPTTSLSGQRGATSGHDFVGRAHCHRSAGGGR